MIIIIYYVNKIVIKTNLLLILHIVLQPAQNMLNIFQLVQYKLVLNYVDQWNI